MDLIIGKKEKTYGPGKKKIKIKNSQLKIISKMWSEVNKNYQKINIDAAKTIGMP